MQQPEPDSGSPDRREERATDCLHLELFGMFRLRQGDQPLPGFEQARLQHLLAYLVLHRAAPISRQQLAFLFWPDSADQQALKNLRTSLSRLRRKLPGADQFISVTDQTIQWRLDAPFTLDVADFETAAGQANAAKGSGDDTGAVNALTTAITRYTGELLPDCYDDWILPLRERYHQTCAQALEQLVRLLEEHREYRTALPFARRMLDHDPLHEAAYHHLIRLHLALGDRTEALRTCRACDAMLEREFGITPARATRYLYERLLDQEDRPATAAMEPPPGTSPAGLPLVGRQDEWARLMTAWRESAAGHSQMILLSGEAGIGKTRLAEELCAWVARQRTAVAVAHCYPASGAAVAYAPVVEWLRDRGLQARLAALDDVWLVEIARLLPALLVERPHLMPPGPLTEAWQRTRLFEALAHAVLGSDDRVPLLLFLDDLHWCDQETLDWLGYLLRYESKAPLLILATVRKYEIDRVHPLMTFWLALTRSGLLSELPLDALDAAETRLLAEQVAGRTLQAGEAAQIYHAAEGNPLFVVEMVRSGMAEPAAWSIPATPATLPPKVRAVIEWRLAQLSPPAQALARIAAVIGRQFSVEVLARTSDQDKDTILAGLDELWQHQLVRAQGATAYDFSHDGIRTVAHDDIPPLRRRAIHQRVARALEELHQDDLDAISSQIASHYEQAGQAQPAIAFYRRAASVAEGMYANTAAAQLYQHLLESDLSAGLSAVERCGVMLSLAAVWRATGKWSQAETLSRNALAEARTLGDSRLAAQARCALADVLHLLGYYDAALQRLAEAEQDFRAANDRPGLAGALRIAGEIHWLRGDYSQALDALEQQLKIASEIDDKYSTCEALQSLGMVYWSQGNWTQAAANCLQAIQIAAPLGYKPILTRASITLGSIRSGEHWFGEAVYWYQHAGALARETDDRQALSWAIHNIALILGQRGDYDRASAGYERSLRIAWEIGDRRTACGNIAGLAAIKERLEEAAEAESLYRLAIEFGTRLNLPGFLCDVRLALARLLLAQSRPGDAYSLCESVLAQIADAPGEGQIGEDTRFEAQVLNIRLRHTLGETTGLDAANEFRALLPMQATPLKMAALFYELWRLNPADETTRTAASVRYHAEYVETGAHECRRRYQELTGAVLPDPPPLPDVSDLVPDLQDRPALAQILADLKALFE